MEVIVALTLLAVGVLTVAGSASFATRLIRLAEIEEEAARIGAALADSLAFTSGWSAAAVDRGRYRLEWNGGRPGDEVRVLVRLIDAPAVEFVFLTTAPPLLDFARTPPTQPPPAF